MDVPRPPLLMKMKNHRVEPLSPIATSKVPITDRSFPNSPVKKDVSQFGFVVPESPNAKSKRVDRLMHDRYQVKRQRKTARDVCNRISCKSICLMSR